MDRILIDESLSPKLVAVAKARGHDATHILYLGKAGIQDWNIIPLLADHDFVDFVFVTNNAYDFLKLFARLEIHNGLIIIIPNDGLEQQTRLFTVALEAAERMDDLVNKLLEVREPGLVEIRDWPSRPREILAAIIQAAWAAWPGAGGGRSV